MGQFTEGNEGNEGQNEGGNSGLGLPGERVVLVRETIEDARLKSEMR